MQFSDTHWGYSGAANPDAEHTLEKAVATVNGLARQPDFIVFTGDLTHTTDDAKRAPRAHEALPRDRLGAHASRTCASCRASTTPRSTAARPIKEFFGAPHYTFDHKGVHFIALDNVSDPARKLGDEQLAWLAADLKQRKPTTASSC